MWSGLLNLDPLIRGVQIGLGVLAGGLVFLVFYATRDILRRTDSLLYQLACIFLVAALPVAGFFLYLLVRPSRTLKSREIEENVREILAILKERKELIAEVKSKAKKHVEEWKKSDANVRIQEAMKRTPVLTAEHA